MLFSVVKILELLFLYQFQFLERQNRTVVSSMNTTLNCIYTHKNIFLRNRKKQIFHEQKKNSASNTSTYEINLQLLKEKITYYRLCFEIDVYVFLISNGGTSKNMQHDYIVIYSENSESKCVSFLLILHFKPFSTSYPYIQCMGKRIDQKKTN